MKSFSQEEINIWFKNLEGHSRIELMCTLLDSCLPLELRFLGTYLEYAAGKHYTHLLKLEKDANNKNSIYFSSLSDQETRRRLCIFLALLHSHNKIAALNLFNILNEYSLESKTENVLHRSDSIEKSAENKNIDDNWIEKTSRNEMKLLLTMGSFHPAFNFNQRQSLRKKLKDFVSDEKQCNEQLNQKCKEGNLIDFETACSVENFNHVDPASTQSPVTKSKVQLSSSPLLHNVSEIFSLSNGFPFSTIPIHNNPVYIQHPPLIVEHISDRMISPINKQFVYIPVDQPIVASNSLNQPIIASNSLNQQMIASNSLNQPMVASNSLNASPTVFHSSEAHLNKFPLFNCDKTYAKHSNGTSENILQNYIAENIENNNIDTIQCKNILMTEDLCSSNLFRLSKNHRCQNSEPNINGIDNLIQNNSFLKKIDFCNDASNFRYSHAPILFHSQPINNFSYSPDMQYRLSPASFSSSSSSIFPKVMSSFGKARNGFTQQSSFVDTANIKAAVNSTQHIRDLSEVSTANIFYKPYSSENSLKKNSSEEPLNLSPCSSPIVCPYSSSNDVSSVCMKMNLNKDQISCATWLKSLRLHKYYSKLKDYSFKTMKDLSDKELCQLGLTKGARARFRVNIDLLRQQGFEEFADPPPFDAVILNDSITPSINSLSLTQELRSISPVDPIAMLMHRDVSPSILDTTFFNGTKVSTDEELLRKTSFVNHDLKKDSSLSHNFSNLGVSSKHVTCYNCGYFGHYGDECTEQTMESQTYSRYAFHLDFARNADVINAHDPYDESITSR
uniref:Zinc finger CCHC domain-containing protein 2 n=1 Tax=Hydra vulgaris TaxID=6087 RepID=T2M5D0_HYDVU